MTATPHNLAKEFSRQLVSAITPEQLEQVLERNEAETNQNVCHSHDFIDANDCMLAALVTLDIEFDPQSDWQRALLSQAWDIAKQCEFDEEAIARDDRYLETSGR